MNGGGEGGSHAPINATATGLVNGGGGGGMKRKRDEGGSSMRIAVGHVDDVDSPLHSPGSSSSHQLATAPSANGVSSRRSGSKLAARRRNIDRVHFGQYDIKTWYFSPYQFDEEEWASMATTEQTTTSATTTTATAAVDATDEDQPAAKSIWVCDGCFKYMRTYSGFRAHKRDCRHTHPPGHKVYQRGAHTIWEVDGAKEKLYAQNLSLFGKLFIDHKTIYFDVEPFVFYVLTDATSSFDHVIGYFSKEKISYDEYNLACIITFPPYQKSGFGTLMIEFSYYLSSLTSILGTPERPLSDLGLKGYLAFWSSVALRTLALLFDEQDPDVRSRLMPASYKPTKGRVNPQSVAANAAKLVERQRSESVRLRTIVLGLTPAPVPTTSSDESARPFKGYAGEVAHQKAPVTPQVEQEWDSINTTLDRLAVATSLRIEDLCFALSDTGLLRQKPHSSTMELVITRNAVREAIVKKNIKRPVMDVQYVLQTK